mmetsp:Transcript_7010/g.15299  ORF Transcript_7010/g.15299 Transcript_7010/m.15299 type:complete len:117 (-) Transcript_7010:374-724(-)
MHYRLARCLVVRTTNPLVDNVQHVFPRDGGVAHKNNDSKHGKSPIDNLGSLGDARVLVVGDETVGLIVLGARLKKERVREGERAEGGAEGQEEEVHVGNKDDGTLVGDGVLVGDGG